MKEPEHPLRSIFGEALAIPDVAERSAFLDQACGQNSVLRREVDELLQAQSKSGKFLPEKARTTASRAAWKRLTADQLDSLTGFTEKPGDRIGRYELVEQIGEGGCGVVYLARQETPVRREVALKVIKIGMDTKQVIARFEAERQALAMMEHPSIAKVFDAGVIGSQAQEFTDLVENEEAKTGPWQPGMTGRPFFVMELVRGSKITDYCNHHGLSTPERVNLFIQVCQAVQHAHQKGIIHRDLKPSNILVAVSDGLAVPKVIDFGIAKATEGKLTDHTFVTSLEQFLGTPAYMSPEQAAMTTSDIDTRSDIYSLGVLLYELLARTTPFDTKALLTLGVDELRRTIREKDPIRPSLRLTRELQASEGASASSRAKGQPRADSNHVALPHCDQTKELVRQLRGDLDCIVMKCLEKDRARRYATANGLAEDLQRFLRNEPVAARPPSRMYELRKTVSRHRGGFAAALTVLLALVAGVITSSWQAARASRSEKEQAELKRQAQVASYTSDMNLSYQEWAEGKLPQARARLETHLPRAGQADLRGFEWRFLWNLCRDERTRTVRFGDDDPVRQLAATPAHHIVAAACEKSIRLLEPTTGKELARLSYPEGAGTGTRPLVALAARSTNLLAAHRANGVISLWDLASRKQLAAFQTFTNNAAVLALSPNGAYLAAADRDQRGFYSTVLAVWDISKLPQPPRLVWSHPIKGGTSAMTFTPDGQAVIAASSELKPIIECWDTESGRALRSILNPAAGTIWALAFSPDGTLLASSGVEGRICVWDFSTGVLRFGLDGHSNVGSLVFSRDGSLLYSGGGDGLIRRWDLASRSSSSLWRIRQSGEVSIALVSDEKKIVAAAGEEVRIGAPEPRQESAVLKVQPGWSSIVVSPDGTKIIVADPDDTNGSNGAAVWDIASGKHLFDLVPDRMVAKSLAFSPDGRLFAASSLLKDGLIALWSTSAWQTGASRVRPFAYLTNGFESACIRFSPDGKILAAAGLSFAPDAPKVPSGATNRLAFWEVGSWKKVDLLPGAGAGPTEWSAAATVDFSSDGRFVALGSRDGWVRLWDLKKRQLLMESQRYSGNDLWGVIVQFSPDSRSLSSYRMGWSHADIWDLTNSNFQRHTFGADETSGIMWATFASDSKTFITACNDGMLKFWNMQSHQIALSLRHSHGPGGFLDLARDGAFLASKDANDTVKIWKAPLLKEIDQSRSLSPRDGH